ncbi:unnamed protein product, partial [Meganyctiphanes norvegica]
MKQEARHPCADNVIFDNESAGADRMIIFASQDGQITMFEGQNGSSHFLEDHDLDGTCQADSPLLDRPYGAEPELYRERVTQVEAKLEEVRHGGAGEYLGPLEDLEEGMRIRLEVACVLRQYRLNNINNKHEAELVAAKQNYENEKVMLWDLIESELEDKIRRLEEDRNNVDVTSEVWAEQNLHRKKRRHRQGSNSSLDHRRRKPTTVAGPYIIYMLREPDIVEDWTTIKKALTASKRKTKFGKIASPRHCAEALSLI